jgi:exonuclease III
MDAMGEAEASFVFGDFNEPSHRDWTESAVKAGLQPLAVPFPTVKAIEAKGFVDTFRAIYPDPATKPGFTWTPTSDPTSKDDHHDRIDFALAKGATLTVETAGIVGEKAPEADIVVTPWPSDHRATYAKVKF